MLPQGFGAEIRFGAQFVPDFMGLFHKHKRIGQFTDRIGGNRIRSRIGVFSRVSWVELRGVEIGVLFVVEAFHELPSVDHRVRGVGPIGAIPAVGGRAAVDEDERAVGGGGEGNEVMGVAFPGGEVVDERRR